MTVHRGFMRRLAAGLVLGAGLSCAQAFVVHAGADACLVGTADEASNRTHAIADTGLQHGLAYGGVQTTCWGRAETELNTGRLRTYAYGDSGGSASGTASFEDTLTFVAPASFTPGALVIATFRLSVDGRFAGDYSHFDSKTQLTLFKDDHPVGLQDIEFIWAGRLGPEGRPTVQTKGFALDLSTEPSQLHGVLEMPFFVTPGHRFGITAWQQTLVSSQDNGMGTADFSHTATLSIELPPGWSYTSESMALLAPVPEPPALVLALAGLMAVVALLMKR